MSQRATFEGAFLLSLTTLFDVEKQLVGALAKMANRASSAELRHALAHHLDDTRDHVSRLEEMFVMLDADPAATRCAAIAGIIDDGVLALQRQASESVRDACIVATAQRIEYFEIAAYGAAIVWAEALGHDDVASLLQETLGEETAAAERLVGLTDFTVNAAAGEDAGSIKQDPAYTTKQDPAYTT
jgi:ferritin-like metal-binding protein YciE